LTLAVKRGEVSIATHREVRRYGVPLATLWEVVERACSGLELTVEESDPQGGSLRAVHRQEQTGGLVRTQTYEIRLREVPEQPGAVSLQLMVQDLLALDGGTLLSEAARRFFDRVERTMEEAGLRYAPPEPAAVVRPRGIPTLAWVAGAFVVLAVLAGLSLAGVFFPKPGPTTPEASTAAKATPPGAKEKTVPDLSRVQGSVVKLETDKGDIYVELFDKQAPITAGNFLLLAKSGFYDGLTFHRVEPGFVIQGGDPEGTGRGGPGFTIPDELKPDLKHDRGILSMAKTAEPNTGGSQFFIVTGPREAVAHLDMKHSVFGKVLEGMDVVDRITVGDKMIKVSIVKASPDAEAAQEAAEKARVPAPG